MFVTRYQRGIRTKYVKIVSNFPIVYPSNFAPVLLFPAFNLSDKNYFFSFTTQFFIINKPL